MPYRYSGGYITPPRADIAQDIDLLIKRELEGYWSEIKKNGTSSVIFVDPDRNVVGYNRHGEQHRAWQFTEPTAAIFKAIPGHDWFVFNGELLHNKTPTIKNQHYLYDVLVAEGIGLTGTTYEFRYQLLFDILAKGKTFEQPTPQTQFWRLDDYTSIARVYKSGFLGIFNKLTAKEDEGLVLRRPDGIYTGAKADDWMCKFRRKELTKLY